MNKTLTALIIASVLFSVGCSSTGNHQLKRETEASVEKKIIKNQTTKTDIRKMFGAPATVEFVNNQEIWKYEFSATSHSAVNYIPGINRLGSSSSDVQKGLTITFNGNLVVDYTMSETVTSSKTGVFS